MSGCGPADRPARWSPSGPPRWTIRRTVAVTVASLSSLALLALPAVAAATIAPAEVAADSDVPLTLTVTEPDSETNEAYGDTARVVVAAPSGFSVLTCGSTPIGWSCAVAEDATTVTFERSPLLPASGAASREFGFEVHTATVNGPYAFRVSQADDPPAAEGEDPPTTITSRPAVTVTGGQAPGPEPTTAPGSGGDSTNDGGSTSGGDTTGDSGSAGGDGSSGSTTTDSSPGDGDDSTNAGTTDGDDGATGSTAPRRTEGRASGTTLEITPGKPVGDDPAVAPPDVADDPAIAPPEDDPAGGDAGESTAVAATGTRASQEPGGGPPWQQVVGAAMLLVGGAVVAIRRWDLVGRLRGLEPLTLLRRRSG